MYYPLDFYDAKQPAGVPNPYGPRLHSYPTRYHGPIYTRPMYSLPFVDRPYDFGVETGTAGLGTTASPLPPIAVGLGVLAVLTLGIVMMQKV